MTAHVVTTRRNGAEQARLEAAIADVFEQQITFNQTLGLKLASLGDNEVTARFEMHVGLTGHRLSGRLHGGVTAAVLDTTGGLLIMWALAEKYADESPEQVLHRFNRVGTIDLRTDFLRQGVGRVFTARAHLLRLGGHFGSVQMQLHNEEGVLLATGAGTYVSA